MLPEDNDDLPVPALPTSVAGNRQDDFDLLLALANILMEPQPDDPNQLLTHIEDIAQEHDIDTEKLLSALEQPELVREIRSKARVLRRQGELLRNKVIPVLERMVDAAGRLVDEDAISPSVMPRLMDSLYRLAGIGDERAARLRAATGTATVPTLTMTILDGDMPEPVIPPGGLALTIIAPTWKGRERVVSEQEGGGQ